MTIASCHIFLRITRFVTLVIHPDYQKVFRVTPPPEWSLYILLPYPIAVKKDWKKCGTFSSFRWLSPVIYHINIWGTRTRWMSIWAKVLSRNWRVFLIKNMITRRPGPIIEVFAELFRTNVSYSENYCDFQRFFTYLWIKSNFNS